jgi:hypothetical protein
VHAPAADIGIGDLVALLLLLSPAGLYWCE